jgi:hypothetical protein
MGVVIAESVMVALPTLYNPYVSHDSALIDDVVPVASAAEPEPRVFADIRGTPSERTSTADRSNTGSSSSSSSGTDRSRSNSNSNSRTGRSSNSRTRTPAQQTVSHDSAPIDDVVSVASAAEPEPRGFRDIRDAPSPERTSTADRGNTGSSSSISNSNNNSRTSRSSNSSRTEMPETATTFPVPDESEIEEGAAEQPPPSTLPVPSTSLMPLMPAFLAPCPIDHCRHVPAPELWLRRDHWRRLSCYKLIGVDSMDGRDCGVYRCQMPRDQGVCGCLVRDQGQDGHDLNEHLAQYHALTQLPAQFQLGRRPWSSGLCRCFDDPLSCVDCVLCPCCFLGRLEYSTELHWQSGVSPYARSFTNERAGCIDNSCETCLAITVVQPALWLLLGLPTACCFVFRDDDSYLMCPLTSPAVFRTKHNANIDEDQCTTKCKMLWCCPLQACQTYRELRSAGVNPGLTCCTRSAESEAGWVESCRAGGLPRLHAAQLVTTSSEPLPSAALPVMT